MSNIMKSGFHLINVRADKMEKKLFEK
jgi:hypothetical protein